MKRIKAIILIIFFCCFLSACTSDKNIKEIKKATKLSEKQAIQIFNAVQSVGFPEIHSAECQHHGTEYFFCSFKNYELFNKSIMIYLSQDGNVTRITDYSHDLYKDGKLIANLLDYNVAIDDLIYLINNSKEKTKIALKSPSTAIFPRWQEWAVGIKKNKISVSSYVDAQNIYGAMVRTPIEFVYNRSKKFDNTFEYTFSMAKIGNSVIK